MKRITAFPQPRHDTEGTRMVGHAGGLLLTKTVVVRRQRATGLNLGLSTAFGRWRKPLATH